MQQTHSTMCGAHSSHTRADADFHTTTFPVDPKQHLTITSRRAIRGMLCVGQDQTLGGFPWDTTGAFNCALLCSTASWLRAPLQGSITSPTTHCHETLPKTQRIISPLELPSTDLPQEPPRPPPLAALTSTSLKSS